jgi:hypothetical protein
MVDAVVEFERHEVFQEAADRGGQRRRRVRKVAQRASAGRN